MTVFLGFQWLNGFIYLNFTISQTIHLDLKNKKIL